MGQKGGKEVSVQPESGVSLAVLTRNSSSNRGSNSNKWEVWTKVVGNSMCACCLRTCVVISSFVSLSSTNWVYFKRTCDKVVAMVVYPKESGIVIKRWHPDR